MVAWGIIGFGWVARDFVAPAIRDAGHRLAAVCDPDPAARAAGERLGARAYATADELCADESVEAVYVATPNHLHRAGVEAAARAGRAVLCEKPMAAGLDDAEAMVRTVERAGILYGTAFDQRHHPAHRAIRAALREGAVGAVTAVRIVYACWLGPDWGAGDNWRIDGAKAGGGALMDLAPHGLDLASFLTDSSIEAVAALTQTRIQPYAVDDGAVLIARLSGGPLLTLHVAYNHPETLPRRRLEIVGDQGLIVAENTMGQDPGGRVTLTDARTGSSRPLPVPGAERSPFLEQILAFGHALRSGDHRAFDATRDLHGMRCLMAAYGSEPTAVPVRPKGWHRSTSSPTETAP
ncbi:Gfo/Idh/MocA family protein [Salinarimonas soli]|uniref:Gfo/Idh/MocA family oxidoreductase n=1 Tax=Salinarimonas soli TaxID=1638099 RepID=A0A5B2VTH8_9HYPH|nr:Gfo/Idh/MocA family oxidoreductase [Salinarimonas soli]KAA2242335.1 Gfo/Idh/MocA family oxidoreductase [Salinarimonas soli]